MEHHEFLSCACIEAEALDAWIAAGWLAPTTDGEGPQFAEIDVARVQLIKDLQIDVGVNEEGVGVILGLIDQLHGLRRTLGDLLSAIRDEPDDIRERLTVHVQRTVTGLARPAARRAQPAGDRQD
jgi:chaperone modulatory protein CbpM